MLLDMAILSDHLTEITKSRISEDYRRQFQGVRIFRTDKKVDWDHYVYLVTETEQKAYDWERDYAWKRIIFINPEDFQEENWQDEEYLCLKTERTLEEIAEEIQGIFEWYSRWEQNLLKAEIGKKSIQEIMDIAAEAFQNPIAVFDNATHLLAWAGKMPEKRDALWDMVLTENVAYASEMMRLYREKNIILDVEKGKRAAIYILNDPVWPDTMQANIYDPQTGQRLGNLGGTGIVSPITKGELSKMDYLAGCLSSVLADYNRSLNNERQQLLLNALEGRAVSRELFEQQLFGGMTVKLYKLRILVLLPIRQQEILKVEANAILAKIQHICGEQKCLLAYMKGKIVLLTSEEEYQQQLGKWQQKFRGQCPDLAMGISNMFSNIRDASKAFRQAEIAAQYGISDEKQPVHEFWEDIYRYMGDLLEKELTLRMVCDGDIYKIYQYDKNHETLYLQTLKSYLVYGHNLSKAAGALYIHRNTMMYRMERLKELFGEDVLKEERTAELLFAIQLIEKR